MYIMYNDKEGSMRDVIGIFKRFFFFLIIILFLEVFFAIIVFHHLAFDSIANIFLYSMMVASLLSIITGIFHDKTNTIITAIIYTIRSILLRIFALNK